MFHEQISSQQGPLVKIIKRRKMKLGRYVARIGETKVNKNFKSGDLERENHFG